MSKDKTGAPRVTEMKVVPVAGQDSMLLNLSGAHGPFFTRNLVILTDSAGNTGLGEVPTGQRLAGQALGMTAGQVMRQVELPQALPAIVAGVRTATSIAIGTATIAAFIGAGGYGERIVTGLALNDGQMLLAGALPATLLALLSEALFEGVEHLMRQRRA